MLKIIVCVLQTGVCHFSAVFYASFNSRKCRKVARIPWDRLFGAHDLHLHQFLEMCLVAFCCYSLWKDAAEKNMQKLLIYLLVNGKNQQKMTRWWTELSRLCRNYLEFPSIDWKHFYLFNRQNATWWTWNSSVYNWPKKITRIWLKRCMILVDLVRVVSTLSGFAAVRIGQFVDIHIQCVRPLPTEVPGTTWSSCGPT